MGFWAYNTDIFYVVWFLSWNDKDYNLESITWK